MNHKMRLSLSKSLVLILLLNGLFATYLLVKPGPPQTLTLIDNLTQGLLEGVGLFLVLPLRLPWDQKRPSAHLLPAEAAVKAPSQQWVPLFLGLGILSYVIGQGIWTYNENIAHLPMLFPSWADAGWLGSFPFVLLAILLLPRRPLPIEMRARILVEGLIIIVGMVTLGWYSVLGPTILNGQDTVVGRIIGTAYPLATLVLIFCLLLLAARRHIPEMQTVVLLLSLALITIVITDSIYDYLQLHNLYATGGLLDVGWPLGYMLLGLSAHAMHLQPTCKSSSTPPLPEPAPYAEKREGSKLSSSLWRALIPLFCVCTVALLLILTEDDRANPALEMGVFVGVTMLLALMVVQQLLVIREAIKQNHLLHSIQQDLWARNEELHRANVQIEEQARIEGAYEQQRRLNEMKDQFILNVSHELRTPLTQLYGYLDLLRTYHHTLTDDMRLEFIHKATQGCEALLPLVNTILDAAGKEVHMAPPQGQELVVADLVYEVLDQFEPLQRQEHPVHVEIAEGLVVHADPQTLSQVLRNLLSNAFKYTPPQTPVRVVATRCDSAEHCQDGTSQVRIGVQDSGPGIPPEDIPLLFGKFVRLKRDLAGRIPGTGLGLYISKQLVEAMGGRIWVESSGVPGQGSAFYFTLPVARMSV